MCTVVVCAGALRAKKNAIKMVSRGTLRWSACLRLRDELVFLRDGPLVSPALFFAGADARAARSRARCPDGNDAVEAVPGEQIALPGQRGVRAVTRARVS